MDIRKKIENERQKLKVSWSILEQDYVISWVLKGLSSVPELRENLVFKGGTALKKVFFESYRFSQDLDFSTLPATPRGNDLEDQIIKACGSAQDLMEDFMPNPVLECSRYEEKMPHPEGQEAFTIRAQLPWHRKPFVPVMIEVTRNEKLVEQPQFKSIKSSYHSETNCSLLCYTLEEIFAEKLRSILQNIKKLHERGWTRSRARDFYDLWSIIGQYDTQMNWKNITPFLREKCEGKGVCFKGIYDFFDPLALKRVKKDWNQ